MSDDYLLDIGDVGKRVSISRSGIYKMLSLGTFPKPVKIGDKAIRWRASTIQDWIACLPDAQDED